MKDKSYLKLFFVFLFVIIASFFYWIINGKPLIGIDDANIAFVYMRNLASGNGFVYNINGEHVEGITCLLWTLAGSIFFMISTTPELFFFFLNILLITFALWRLVIFTDKLFNDSRTITPSAYFIFGCLLIIPGYFDWTIISLIETGLWSCLLLLIIILLCNIELGQIRIKHSSVLFSVLLILLVLSRPESYLWGTVFLLIRFWQLMRHHKNIFSSAKYISTPLISFALACVGLTAWRIFYFGYPFPNTYYAKVSSNHLANVNDGLQYLKNFFTNNKFCILISFAGMLFIIQSVRKKFFDAKTFTACIVAVSIFTSLLIPVYTGGDHFVLFRFIEPTIPLFYFLFVLSVSRFSFFSERSFKNYLATTLLLVGLCFLPGQHLLMYKEKAPLDLEFRLAEAGRTKGEKLSNFFYGQNPMPSQGVLTGGGQAYSYTGISIDLFGLSNVAMAHANPVKTGIKNHAAFDKNTFYKLHPDLCMTISFVKDTTQFQLEENSNDFAGGFIQDAYKNIFADERFRENYFPVFVSKKNIGEYLHAYASKDFLMRLDTSVYSWSLIYRGKESK